MSILAKLFRFFPRTRGEEQLIHFSVALSSGTVGAVGGNSTFVTSVTKSATGKYDVVLSKGFPALLGIEPCILLGSAPTKESSVVLYALDAAAGTFSFAITNDNALASITGSVYFTLFFAANTAPYA